METTCVMTAKTVVRLDIRAISPNPAQPRKLFDENSLLSLAESIRMHGLLSPLLVRRINAGRFELIAGERRLRALKILGRSYADALVITAYDLESAVMALIENVQREQLHYLDEAEACRAILDNDSITQEALAARLGKSPSALANRLRLIRLSAPVKDLLKQSSLTERHARALLSAHDPEKQLEFASAAIRNQLTVRQLEQRISRTVRTSPPLPRCIARDHRLYVNAVIDTVDRLRSMGVSADITMNESDSGTEIHILLKNTN